MNWVLIALWAAMTVLLFRSCGQQQQGPIQTSGQLLTTLKQQNRNLLEASAAQTYNQYKSALQSELNLQKQMAEHGKATQSSVKELESQMEAKEIQGAILVADAQLRGGRVTGNYNKYFLAYETLQSYELKDANNPDWTQAQYRTYNRKGEVSEWTGQALYNQVVKELEAQNEQTKVYGFLPGYQIIDLLVKITGRAPGFSYWFAALLLAVAVRSIVWPLTKKQFKFGRQMMQLTPRINEIKAKHPNDMTGQQTEIMALYKEYGINPAAGCFPMLLQMPFFIGVYDCMLRYRFAFQRGTFAWINPSVAAHTHGFTAPNLGQQDNLLILIYAVSMLSSQFLMPVSDPSQVKQQRLMGAIISIAIPVTMFLGLYTLPSAFVLYWTFTNIIATAQALLVYRYPVPPLEKVVTSAGGIIPGKKPTFWGRIQSEMERRYEEARGMPAPSAKDPKEQNKSFWDRIQDDARKAMNEKNSNTTSGSTGSNGKPKKRVPNQAPDSKNGTADGQTNSAKTPSNPKNEGKTQSQQSDDSGKPKRRK